MTGSYYGHAQGKTSAFARPEDITEDDLLTWEVQLRKEGTLPPEVQLRLLEHAADKTIAIDLPKVETYDGGHKDGYDEGYEAGRASRLGVG